MEKFFSIIVPVYNVEKYLKDCIESILNQSFTDFELILVDDGSPDNCPEICDEYSKKDDRIKVIHKENGGLSDARNAGMKISGGKFLTFIDSDDALEYDDALKDLESELNAKNHPDVLLTRYPESEFQDGILGETLINQMVTCALEGKKFNITVWDKIYKRDFIINNNLFFKKGLVHEDLIWTTQTLDKAERCEFTNTNFYHHNEVEGSITRSASEKSILRRSTSKLWVAKTNMDYFKQKDFEGNKYGKIYEFFMGVYISGIVESKGLKEKDSEKLLDKTLRETIDALDVGFKTSRIDYKLLTLSKKIFGINSLKLIRFLK